MSIKNQRDFVSGLLFTTTGAVFAVGAASYSIGTAARMGPGYFPLVLGIMLSALGIVVTVRATRAGPDEDGGKIGAWAWRPLLFILLANLAFGATLAGVPGLSLPSLGLIPGIYALTFIASHAAAERNLREVAGLATALSVISYVVFVLLLKLQLPVWPAFFSR